MHLRLVGLLSGSDKYGRLMFVKEDTAEGKDDMDKLWRLQKKIEGRSPITNKGYAVVLNKTGRNQVKKEDLDEFMGCHCKIRVRVKEYDFVNKEGVQMKGFTLVLDQIGDLEKN